MNTKITIVELARMMADATSTTNRICELFLRELFKTVSEALIDGDSVKIKGIGTFKVTEVKPRKSVSVKTNKTIEINSYKKVTFTPAKSLADVVNQPFAQFETVMLNDEVTDEKLDEIDKQYPSFFNEALLDNEAPIPEPDIDPELIPEPDPEFIPQSVPEPQKAEVQVEQKMLAASGIPVAPPQEATQEATQEPIEETVEESETRHVEPLMGIPIDGPSTPEPEPKQKEEEEDDEYFYRPAPRNTFTPTQEQISQQQSRMDKRRLWSWLIPALVAVGIIAWLLTRCGGKAEQPQTAVVADSDSVAAAEKEKTDAITDTVTAQIVLSTLSDKYYDSPWFWVYIYEENKAIISDPNNVRPGTAVVIPPAEKYGIDAKDPASLKRAQRRSWEILMQGKR